MQSLAKHAGNYRSTAHLDVNNNDSCRFHTNELGLLNTIKFSCDNIKQSCYFCLF